MSTEANGSCPPKSASLTASTRQTIAQDYQFVTTALSFPKQYTYRPSFGNTANISTKGSSLPNGTNRNNSFVRALATNKTASITGSITKCYEWLPNGDSLTKQCITFLQYYHLRPSNGILSKRTAQYNTMYVTSNQAAAARHLTASYNDLSNMSN